MRRTDDLLQGRSIVRKRAHHRGPEVRAHEPSYFSRRTDAATFRRLALAAVTAGRWPTAILWGVVAALASRELVSLWWSIDSGAAPGGGSSAGGASRAAASEQPSAPVSVVWLAIVMTIVVPAAAALGTWLAPRRSATRGHLVVSAVCLLALTALFARGVGEWPCQPHRHQHVDERSGGDASAAPSCCG